MLAAIAFKLLSCVQLKIGLEMRLIALMRVFILITHRAVIHTCKDLDSCRLERVKIDRTSLKLFRV
jgi:hypothetical protein